MTIQWSAQTCNSGAANSRVQTEDFNICMDLQPQRTDLNSDIIFCVSQSPGENTHSAKTQLQNQQINTLQQLYVDSCMF